MCNRNFTARRNLWHLNFEIESFMEFNIVSFRNKNLLQNIREFQFATLFVSIQLMDHNINSSFKLFNASIKSNNKIITKIFTIAQNHTRNSQQSSDARNSVTRLLPGDIEQIDTHIAKFKPNLM